VRPDDVISERSLGRQRCGACDRRPIAIGMYHSRLRPTLLTEN